MKKVDKFQGLREIKEEFVRPKTAGTYHKIEFGPMVKYEKDDS